MMRPADAERLTGYHVGGISPFGQKKRVPVAIEEAALGHASVFLNGGQRGLQVELDAARRREGGGRDRARTRGVSGLCLGVAAPPGSEFRLGLRP